MVLIQAANAYRIVNRTFIKGGATFRADGELIRVGYSVGGIVPAVLTSQKRFSPGQLNLALSLFADFPSYGTWEPRDKDGKPGDFIHVEPVDIVHTEEEALALGRARAQHSVYCLHTETEILC